MSQVWIRHGATELASGYVCGQIDPEPLLLPEECNRLTSVLTEQFGADYQAVEAWSSPLKRCLLLGRRLGLQTCCSDDRLKELSFGEWEGLLWDDVPRQELDYWAEDYLNRSPPGGESLFALQTRLQGFLEDRGTHPLIVLTHGGIIRALATLCGWAPEQAMAMSVPLASAFVLRPDGLLRLD